MTVTIYHTPMRHVPQWDGDCLSSSSISREQLNKLIALTRIPLRALFCYAELRLADPKWTDDPARAVRRMPSSAALSFRTQIKGATSCAKFSRYLALRSAGWWSPSCVAE